MFIVSFTNYSLGVTTCAKAGNSRDWLVAPFRTSGRAIRATSVASCYPSRTLRIKPSMFSSFGSLSFGEGWGEDFYFNLLSTK
jgi:hypothetical protein